jgi:hypothetical protein
MKIINQQLLQEFREKQQCEFCLRRDPYAEVHHVFGRGQEGCRRFDIAINLLVLCIDCHTKYHNGRIEQWDLLLIVADREGVTPQWIKEEIWRLRRDDTTTVGPTSTGTLPVEPISPPAPPVLRQVVKICKTCGRALPLAQFPVTKGPRPYTRGSCKGCTANYQRAYAQRRKQKL